MKYVLFDDENRVDLLPLTFTRPVADLRLGILTIKEKWNLHLNSHCGFITEDYLRPKFGFEAGSETVFINGSVLPEKKLVEAINNLQDKQLLTKNKKLIAIKVDSADFESTADFNSDDAVEYEDDIRFIQYPWQLFLLNSYAIKSDWELIVSNRHSKKMSNSNKITGGSEKDLFIEEGATVEGCMINTSGGPVYIGKKAEVMEGAMIRGPVAICEGATVKMGAKIYGASTIGPHCKVGGEVNNSIFLGYSNKAHDGFIGNSVIGEWCNLGADTNNSNLKNNYGDVMMYSYRHRQEMATGLQFCGVVMGDHSKTGINTMLNTGTVIGVSANIFGSDFPLKHVPSFSWGGAGGFEEYNLKKAIEVAQRMYERRNLTFDAVEQSIFEEIFKKTRSYI